MYRDYTNEYRILLEKDPPEFVDRVNSPWDQVPDCSMYNASAYRRIVRDLNRLTKENESDRVSNIPSGTSSRGVLVLGEAGTGKTHLLMRVAKKLSETNHILFVRKPNNEEAVARHIWANIVNSLSRILPNSEHSQLDDLLAHVFTAVLIQIFQQDIAEGVNVEVRKRWVNLLNANPFNLFSMLGEGEKRIENMKALRNHTLRYLQTHHPDVDQRITHALITYCFVVTPLRKRLLLTWLSGQDIDENEAQIIGLPATWVEIDDISTDTSAQQQTEEQALRAIRTIGILSTYYQPLILTFDQLEGLRGEERLTQRWGDVVREIFTMTPNLLIITCIFPSLWESWFTQILDKSAAERIAQQTIELERFGPNHAVSMLKTHLEASAIRHMLPTSFFPFTEEDVDKLCAQASSPRIFIQRARAMFESWLDNNDETWANQEDTAVQTKVVTQVSIDDAIGDALEKFKSEQISAYENAIPIEQDAFGRIKNLTQSILDHSDQHVEYRHATYSNYVMPQNFIIKSVSNVDSICIAVIYSAGNAFASRIKNLKKTLQGGTQFRGVIVVRDSRCMQLGAVNQQHVRDFESSGGVFLFANSDEIITLNALYDTLIAVEEHDLSAGTNAIDKGQFIQSIKSKGIFGQVQLLRNAGKLSPCIDRAIRTVPAPISGSTTFQPEAMHNGSSKSEQASKAPTTIAQDSDPGLKVDVLIGDTEIESSHIGILGTLKDSRRRLAISLTKPQCLVVLGYMGSGKSYSLGVLIENALLNNHGLIHQTRPMSVVTFNYRRNPEARFEYAGFLRPNADQQQIEKLRSVYGAGPAAVRDVRVFCYEPELVRRQAEYQGIPAYPIQFRSDELGADHWEILMKPPSPQTEYMDIVRDIIQKLFYEERLTFKNLEKHIQMDERLTEAQRRRATNRLSFAQRWISDERKYEWSDLLHAGTLNIFDLRMQNMTSPEALKLCLIVTDLIRRTRNGVNKMIVFDEAHEYVDSKDLIGELENSITQIRHDGLSFVLASQFPERIPERIFKYLLTRLIFKLPTANAINYLRRAAPNLQSISPQRVSNLDLEQGVCFIQTDDDCTDSLLKVPQLLEVRPRCTQHSGATIRNVPIENVPPIPSAGESDNHESTEATGDESKTLNELYKEFGIGWEKLLKHLDLPRNAGITRCMTLGEARKQVGKTAGQQ
jgi:hypothetical protein